MRGSASTRPACRIRAERLRARLHHGQQSHEVIAPTVTGQLGMAAAGDRDSAYGTVISMAPSHCQSTFVLHNVEYVAMDGTLHAVPLADG